MFRELVLLLLNTIFFGDINSPPTRERKRESRREKDPFLFGTKYSWQKRSNASSTLTWEEKAAGMDDS